MIKLFEQYNEYQRSYNQVKDWVYKLGIEDYTINDDLTVDVDGLVDISNMNLTEIPIQFGKINRLFDCSRNNLTTLKGAPKSVNGGFDCSNNNLTTLEYCPQYIKSDFDFRYNKVNTLKYHPREVDFIIWVDNTDLPIEIITFYQDNDIRDIFNYQEEYGIWNTDGSFNKGRWDIFIKDYENNLLTKFT